MGVFDTLALRAELTGNRKCYFRCRTLQRNVCGRCDRHATTRASYIGCDYSMDVMQHEPCTAYRALKLLT